MRPSHLGAMSHPSRLSWASGLSLDMRLGGRMLAKYPGITLVGGIAMAFAIWFGAVTFELLGQFVYPKLPLPAGERIVKIQNWDAARSLAEPRSVNDFLIWRGQAKTVTDLGAFRNLPRNLTSPGGEVREVKLAEMT